MGGFEQEKRDIQRALNTMQEFWVDAKGHDKEKEAGFYLETIDELLDSGIKIGMFVVGHSIDTVDQ